MGGHGQGRALSPSLRTLPRCGSRRGARYTAPGRHGRDSKVRQQPAISAAGRCPRILAHRNCSGITHVPKGVTPRRSGIGQGSIACGSRMRGCRRGGSRHTQALGRERPGMDPAVSRRLRRLSRPRQHARVLRDASACFRAGRSRPRLRRGPQHPPSRRHRRRRRRLGRLRVLHRDRCCREPARHSIRPRRRRIPPLPKLDL